MNTNSLKTHKLNLYTTKFHSYDSHLHFFGIGTEAVDLLVNPRQQDFVIPEKLLTPNKIIRGFGWSDLHIPQLLDLEKKYPNHFFCLSSFEGHRTFITRNLAQKLSIQTPSPFISGKLRHILHRKLPKRSFKDLEKMALYAQKKLQTAKITKARHLTCDQGQWSVLESLDKKSQLQIQLEVFFSEFMGQNLKQALQSYRHAQKHYSPNLKASGIKVFVDGTLSSNTAFTSNIDKSFQEEKEELAQKMKSILIKEQCPLALHTIGDKALEMSLQIYSDLASNFPGLPPLHLEHAPFFSKKTLSLLETQELNCIFHFQPSHWIEDSHWYTKHQKDLEPHALYPFNFLIENNYAFYFGSDAPVMPPSKELTLEGLEAIEKDQRLNGQI